MNITEHEMRGLLAGKCLPGDMRVNEELPAYLVRKFDELKAQRDALAAENAALTGFIQKDCCVYRSGIVVNAEAYVPETPATDAHLNSVRADAVQELADAWYAIANETSEGVSISDSTRLKYRQRADDAEDFANQLRAGKDGELWNK
ncbi:hypothetical protein [Pantoea sp.]|uniref:hypothetical protein n=1 Tax=Pantoea sp. TaxID=69393 RepID=UPI00290F993A|nr:hypothetical protein [Pantoea sp.]MDU4128672.1 hypothetical protein [Pantoea sp.]